jgi:hypothetical protein
VEGGVFGRDFCKYIFTQLSHRTFYEMQWAFCEYPSQNFLFHYSCLYGLFGFSSKAEARWPVAGCAEPIGAIALPPVRAQPVKRKG